MDEVFKGKPTGRQLRQYDFTNSKGEKVSIRRDNERSYPVGPPQQNHFNAGKSGGDLKQHHNFGYGQFKPGN